MERNTIAVEITLNYNQELEQFLKDNNCTEDRNGYIDKKLRRRFEDKNCILGYDPLIGDSLLDKRALRRGSWFFYSGITDAAGMPSINISHITFSQTFELDELLSILEKDFGFIVKYNKEELKDLQEQITEYNKKKKLL